MSVLRVFWVCVLSILPVLAVAEGTQIAFGGLRQDPNAPVEITADDLSVNQSDGTAVFSGNVVIDQGTMHLSASKVRVAYKEDGDGIERLIASGGVILVSDQDAAEANTAEYSIKDGTIIMSGDVLLTQGQSAFSAQRMTVDIDAGTAHMSGRVKTVLKASNN